MRGTSHCGKFTTKVGFDNGAGAGGNVDGPALRICRRLEKGQGGSYVIEAARYARLHLSAL